MAYKEDLSSMYTFEQNQPNSMYQSQMQPNEETLNQMYQRKMMNQHNPIFQNSMTPQVNYQNLPTKEVFDNYNIKESDDFKTFQRFLRYNDQLSFIERLADRGIITINKPEEKVIEYQPSEEKSDEITFGQFCLGFFGIMLLAVAIL